VICGYGGVGLGRSELGVAEMSPGGAAFADVPGPRSGAMWREVAPPGTGMSIWVKRSPLGRRGSAVELDDVADVDGEVVRAVDQGVELAEVGLEVAERVVGGGVDVLGVHLVAAGDRVPDPDPRVVRVEEEGLCCSACSG
jgi:hypothetical protein